MWSKHGLYWKYFLKFKTSFFPKHFLFIWKPQSLLTLNIVQNFQITLHRTRKFLIKILSLGFFQNNSNALACLLMLLNTLTFGREINTYKDYYTTYTDFTKYILGLFYETLIILYPFFLWHKNDTTKSYSFTFMLKKVYQTFHSLT